MFDFFRYSKTDIEQIEENRGVYTTFLICDNCSYMKELKLPKGMIIRKKTIAFIKRLFLFDEQTKKRSSFNYKCDNCETSGKLKVNAWISNDSVLTPDKY